MRRLALLLLSGGLTLTVVACSPSPAGTPSPPGTPSPASTRSPASTAATRRIVVTRYYRAIAARNYRLAATYLAGNATGPDGRKLTPAEFLRLAGMMDGQEGPVTRFSVAVFGSLIVMTIYRKRAGPYHAHLAVARHGGSWTITSLDRI
jgi:hypothetical protein